MSLEHSPAGQQRSSLQLFEPDQLYSAEQVRRKLGGRTHIITVWKWVKIGRLPKPRKIGANTSRFLGRELNVALFGEEPSNG